MEVFSNLRASAYNAGLIALIISGAWPKLGSNNPPGIGFVGGIRCFPGKSWIWFLYDLRNLTPLVPSGLLLASDFAIGSSPYNANRFCVGDGTGGL